jgi:hypothetical protein
MIYHEFVLGGGGGGYALAAQVLGQWHAKLVDSWMAACPAGSKCVAALSASMRMPSWAIIYLGCAGPGPHLVKICLACGTRSTFHLRVARLRSGLY